MDGLKEAIYRMSRGYSSHQDEILGVLHEILVSVKEIKVIVISSPPIEKKKEEPTLEPTPFKRKRGRPRKVLNLDG
jgi:hypothetical protein